ncbi:hypothetical protein F2P56_016015 [Juglans regia]|nr:hypothetical protein F2P56_016015 [Juglans regia]
MCLLKNFGGVQGVVSAIGSCVENGIDNDAEDIAHRREACGSNTFEKLAAESFFRFAAGPFEYFTIFILVVLSVCAALSFGLITKRHGLKEGLSEVGSMFVAGLLALISANLSTFPLGRSLYKLSGVSNNSLVDVVRSGRRQQISILEVVVGDVVFLKIGDPIPADGLFLDEPSLQVDQSSMTGESDFVHVNCSENPFLFLGTKVVDGHGRMLATSVGMNTFWGEIMSLTNHDYHEQTPLQARLNNMNFLLVKVGLAVAFLVLAVSLARYFTGKTEDENGNPEFSGSQTNLEDILNAVVGIVAAAVTVVVVAIPNGLPLAVRLTLAYFRKRTLADHAILRKLSAGETMGSVTTLCTQETGTLTQSQMKVMQFWLGQDFVAVGAYASIAPNVLELIREGVAHNTTASSPTENAIRSWTVLELTMNIELESYTILHVEASNSQRKRSGVLMRKKADKTVHVHWKGAAEMILAVCSSYYDASGSTTDLNDDERIKIEQVIEGMAARSLHCIAFAHKQVPKEECFKNNGNRMLKEDSLSLLGIVGLKSPCCPGMQEAVVACRNAGVDIKMITGDNLFTAKSVATECGILRHGGQDVLDGEVVEGVEFRNYTPEERLKKLDRICVMAGSSPSDKLLLVECLKQKGHIVAVTDDGTNDPPALREAEVVLSMGIQGSKMDKENSDIIFLDDNFTSVVSALRWGRCIYYNIQKVIQFRLTVTVSSLIIISVAAISGEVPLTVFQLLWVKLVVEAMCALALASEQPTSELMEKPPVCRSEPLITNIMWRNILAQAFYQTFILLTLQINKGDSVFSIKKKVKNAFIFNTYVLCQVFNVLNARNLEKKNVFKGIKRNWLFCGMFGITIVLQAVVVEFLKGIAGTERLDGRQWFMCAALAGISGLIGCVVKLISVQKKPILGFCGV